MLLSILLYAFMGIFVGLLAGLLGVGGGLIIVPLLLAAFAYQGLAPDIAMHMALGTSMCSIIFTSISSSRAHHARGAVDWKVVRLISAGILVGTYAGSMVVAYLPARPLKIFFVCFLLFVAWQMLSGKKPTASRHLPGALGVNGAGLVIGVVSSFVGIGGGSLSVPYLLWNNIPVHKAIGTSAAIGFPIAVAGSIGYFIAGGQHIALPEYSLGYIYLPALIGIVSSSILTAPLGTRLSHSLPVDRLKKCFAVLLLIMAVRMFMNVL